MAPVTKEEKMELLMDSSLVPHTQPTSDPASNATSENRDNMNSTVGTMFIILKAFVGAGVLGLPWVFSVMGLVGASCILLLLGLIFSYSNHVLVEATCLLEVTSADQMTDLDYGEALERAILRGPAPFRRFGNASKISLNIIIFLGQMSGCSVYVLFVADHVMEILKEFHCGIPMTTLIFCLTPIFIMLALIRDIRPVTYVATFGNAVYAVSFIIIFQYVVQDPLSIDILPLVVNDVASWMRPIGVAAFAFDGICLILPVRYRMRHPKQLIGCNGALMTCMYFIILLYFSMGFFSYLHFGGEVKSLITLNLPNTALYNSIKILLPIMILASYVIMLVPAVDIVYHSWLSRYFPPIKTKSVLQNPRSCSTTTSSSSSLRDLIPEYAFRIFCALLHIAIPVVVPILSHLMAFVGSLFLPVNITLPMIIDIGARWPLMDFGWGNWRLFLNTFIAIIGLLISFLGIWIFFADIVHPPAG